MEHLGTKPNVYYIPVKKQTIHFEQGMFNGQNSEAGLHPMGGENGTTFERKEGAGAHGEHHAAFDTNSPFAQTKNAQITDLLREEA